MENSDKEFLFKEYEKLNNEVSNLLGEIRTREKYSLTVIAVVSAWVFTEIIKVKPSEIGLAQKELSFLILLLCWTPLLITVAYGISVLLLYKNIKWIGAYLLKLEDELLSNSGRESGFGWDRYFGKQNRRSYYVLWTWGFWLIQIIISIALVIAGWRY